MTREGGCFCEAIRFEAKGEPVRVVHCHCLHCRKISGAAFVTWAEFPAASFSFTRGKPASFSSRPGATREYCRDCGSPLTWRSHGTPESVDVAACCFDDPSGFRPQDHVWADRQLPWIRLDDSLPRHATSRRRG